MSSLKFKDFSKTCTNFWVKLLEAACMVKGPCESSLEEWQFLANLLRHREISQIFFSNFYDILCLCCLCFLNGTSLVRSFKFCALSLSLSENPFLNTRTVGPPKCKGLGHFPGQGVKVKATRKRRLSKLGPFLWFRLELPFLSKWVSKWVMSKNVFTQWLIIE